MYDGRDMDGFVVVLSLEYDISLTTMIVEMRRRNSWCWR